MNWGLYVSFIIVFELGAIVGMILGLLAMRNRSHKERNGQG